ncbi:restriction endonuclease subunit S [uncultured Lamprocystis sp.]|jgi:type I restriction enzyme S subunit|uniref:restriction endonuclease subunit S n=1 Tax=uncultured Lamprocystis sp. TaxID=543132 RepID=UPI0025DE2C25|nr:restriction endonuclease subunit S [uncultured Lamprocystis sp.]
MRYEISRYEVEKLDAYASILPGFAFKSERFTDNLADIPLVKGENVHQGYIDWLEAKRWPLHEYDAFSRYHLVSGDIVLAMDRPWVTAGLKWSYIKPHDPKSLLVQRVARIRAKGKLDQHYLRHVISSNYFANYLQPIVTGVTVPHISGKQIGDFRIPIPDLGTQRKIAAILTAYDDLIETNKRRIILLEKMAEEIYREWFVRMRFPGYQSTKLVKGVPEGWHFDLSSKFFGHAKGKSYSAHEISDEEGTCFFITLKSFNRRGGYRKEGLKYYSGYHRNEQCVEAGDVVMAVTDMTQDRAVIGEVARIPYLPGKMTVISLDVIKLIPKTISKTFLYAYMRHSGFSSFIKEFANGANVLHLKPDLVGKQRLLFPSEHLQQRFSDLAGPLYQESDNLEEAITLLNKTRDLLLPRLISGKLSVANLDIQFPPSMCKGDEEAERKALNSTSESGQVHRL